VPPSNTEKDNGKRTFDGEIFLLMHHPSTKGRREATSGVFGTIPEIGATTKAKSVINRFEVLILSEAKSSLTLSRDPLLTNADEIENKPIRVIKEGLPKPDNAFWGVRTPVTIKIATVNNPVSSGTIVFFINKNIDKDKTNTVIKAS
tara:strand:+ start:392 stop:832 length:441 start_codon:yes stop_codon:yes gene_type:complete